MSIAKYNPCTSPAGFALGVFAGDTETLIVGISSNALSRYTGLRHKWRDERIGGLCGGGVLVERCAYVGGVFGRLV